MRSTIEMCYQIINQYSGNLRLQLTLQGKYSHINIPNIKPETLRTWNILVPNNYTLFGSCYINLDEVEIPAPRLSSYRKSITVPIKFNFTPIELIKSLKQTEGVLVVLSLTWFWFAEFFSKILKNCFLLLGSAPKKRYKNIAQVIAVAIAIAVISNDRAPGYEGT